MGGSKSTTIGYRYYMAMHMGLCRGPIDEIVQVDVGDVRAFPVPDGDSETVGGLMTIAEGPNGTGVAQYEDGSYNQTDASAINTIRYHADYSINAENLFGGDKREGGVAGLLKVFMGSATQTMSASDKANYWGGRVPSFRGVVSLLFDGLVTSMNPYPKSWQFRVRRTMAGWDGDVWQPSLATIWLRGGTIKAMNGAHILYEVLTNRDWGRGLSRDWIDEASWLAAAQTMHSEGLGLCMRYNRQSELSAFVQEVLDHIGGGIYPDRSTGKLALFLMRGNYDLNSIPLFDYNSGLISLGDVETVGQDDLVNEVVAKWDDPITKTERSARVQNIALNQSMGSSRSTTTSYAGIADVNLALRMCQRDLETNSNALKRFTLTLDRNAWYLTPGSVFRITAIDRGIYNAVLRAGKVSEAGGTDGRITVEAVVDVFGLPSTSFIAAQPSDWTVPNREAVIANNVVVREATYAELVRGYDAANLSLVSTTSGFVATLVGKPSALSLSYDLLVTPDGATEPFVGSGAFAPYVVTTAGVPITADNVTISFGATSDLGLVAVGMACQFGDEIGKLESIDMANKTITVSRGCFDTIPKDHPVGTLCYFYSDKLGSDYREYGSGEELVVKVLPFTSTNRLSPSLAPDNTVDVVGRQGRPYPPARVMVGANHFYEPQPQTGAIVLSWVHRDRLLQQDQLVSHHEASIGPENNTSYTVRVYRGTTLVRTVSGIYDTTWTYTTAMKNHDSITSRVTFELESVRDGITSFEHYRFTVDYV